MPGDPPSILSSPLLFAWLVGLLWGLTNPLVKKGTCTASKKPGNALWAHLTTPAFIVPQVLNQTGSVLFVWLLGVSGALLRSMHLLRIIG
jgi:hypothetical protein